jgi:hypothetical protein
VQIKFSVYWQGDGIFRFHEGQCLKEMCQADDLLPRHRR